MCVCVCVRRLHSERVYVRTHHIRPFIPIRVYLRLQTQYICLWCVLYIERYTHVSAWGLKNHRKTTPRFIIVFYRRIDILCTVSVYYIYIYIYRKTSCLINRQRNWSMRCSNPLWTDTIFRLRVYSSLSPVVTWKTIGETNRTFSSFLFFLSLFISIYKLRCWLWWIGKGDTLD